MALRAQFLVGAQGGWGVLLTVILSLPAVCDAPSTRTDVTHQVPAAGVQSVDELALLTPFIPNG